MSEQDDSEQPDDDVAGHRFLTPDQAQERAEAARRARQERLDETAGSADGDS